MIQSNSVKFHVLIALFLMLTHSNGFAESTASVGQQAPDFTLSDTEGNPISLSSFQGKHVVLEWFNYDCPFVKKHYDSGNMQELQKEYSAKGVVWLSINSSAPGKQGHYTAEEMTKLAQEKQVASSAILLDADGKAGRLYGAQTTPHMFVINPDGKLIYAGAIDSTPSTEASDISKSTNYVKQALEESLAGQPITEPSTKAYGCSVKY